MFHEITWLRTKVTGRNAILNYSVKITVELSVGAC